MLPFTRQTLFFSATMPPEITRLAEQFLSNPERIEASRPATTATTIEQKIVMLRGNDPKLKREALRRVIKGQTVSNGIIFCNRKTDVDIVYKSFTKHGFSIAALHGDLPQPVRTKTLESFRAGSVQLLVASDVAARGLDIPAVSHVFNYDVPHHADDYVHRVGRTGRAGRAGYAFMLVGPADTKYLGAIEKLTSTKLEREDMTDLEVAPDNRPPRDGDRGRDRDGRRGGRDRDKRRGRERGRGDKPYHDEVASMAPVDAGAAAAPTEAVPAVAEQPAKREDKPHRERHPRREGEHRQRDRHPRKQEAPKSEAAKAEQPKREHPRPERPRHEKPAHEKRPRREDRDDGPPSGPGMGPNTPAFLLRPVPQHLLKRKKESEPV
jgi:superfamily II DNA/RNA helicase